MTQQPRPKRKHKHDAMLGMSATADEIRRDMILAPLDNAAKEYDVKWGIDCLVEKVSVDTAKIWGITIGNLNAALRNGWIEQDQTKACADIAACVASALRGLTFMDAEADRLGSTQADTGSLEYYADNGELIIIARDPRSWQAIKEQRPDATIYSLREVSNALEAYGASSHMITETKKHFPAAQIVGIKTTVPVNYAAGGDAINF